MKSQRPSKTPAPLEELVSRGVPEKYRGRVDVFRAHVRRVGSPSVDALRRYESDARQRKRNHRRRRRRPQAGPSAPSTGRKGYSGRRTLTAEERETRRARCARSVHGYRTYGAHATAVLEAVTMIRETPVGDKTALARQLVETNFSRLGEAALDGEVLGSVGIGRGICRASSRWPNLLVSRRTIDRLLRSREVRTFSRDTSEGGHAMGE